MAFSIVQAREKLERHSSLFKLNERDLVGSVLIQSRRCKQHRCTAHRRIWHDFVQGGCAESGSCAVRCVAHQGSESDLPFYSRENRNVMTDSSLFFDEEIHAYR
jgi:hypothetical protein